MRASNEPDSTPVAEPPGPDVRLRVGALDNMMGFGRWRSVAELGRFSGLDQSYLGRLRNGELGLGARSIAGLILAAWRRFGEDAEVGLFEVVDEDGVVTRVCVRAQTESGPKAAEDGPRAASA